DIEILQTPVLEAFTNNTSNMKSKLITITRTNVLYLPIALFNGSTSTGGGAITTSAGETLGGNIVPVAVDNTTMADPSSAATAITRLSSISG
ncbi:MAG TPA: hypothetical protein DCM10_14680, partial [Xanthomarina gelatinilytica]|nr:hypothetical protein [Xanthomarina gelatinilytica]